MRGRFDSVLECYIGDQFWQQVSEQGREIEDLFKQTIVAFWTHCRDKVVWERSCCGRTPLRHALENGMKIGSTRNRF
jgi:hypothetical protein